jgi:hypothetical protein
MCFVLAAPPRLPELGQRGDNARKWMELAGIITLP